MVTPSPTPVSVDSPPFFTPPPSLRRRETSDSGGPLPRLPGGRDQRDRTFDIVVGFSRGISDRDQCWVGTQDPKKGEGRGLKS